MAEILSPCRCNSRIVITSSSSTTDTPTTDLKGNMVGDRQDGAATAAPSYKKLGKITSMKVGSIYPTLTRSDGKLLQQLEERTGSRYALSDASGREGRSVRLHRSVLQPQPSSFVARLCFPGAVPSGLDQSSADQGCGRITRDRWKAKNRGKLKSLCPQIRGLLQFFTNLHTSHVRINNRHSSI